MYAVIRNYSQMKNVEEAARLAESGLGPLLKRQPGFKDYYVIRFAEGGGGSVSVFDTVENARAAHERSLAWVKEHLAPMVGDAKPMVAMGEVLAHVSGKVTA